MEIPVMDTKTEPTITAAVLLIGDEILSGRTKDLNLAYIAQFLAARGIDVREARVVPDVEAEIVAALNALRARYTYVFTTGGIGPTHDDITADAVARAFGVPISHHPEAVRLLQEHFREIGREANEARMRMARLPEGAEMIPNPVSRAPGFHIGNVFVLAGVPKIMQAMLDELAPKLEQGRLLHSRTVLAEVAEGDLATGLGTIQAAYPAVAIGSYPFERDGQYGADIGVRSSEVTQLDAAETAVRKLVEDLQARVPEPKAWT